VRNGVDPISGKQMGPRTGEPHALDTYARLESGSVEQIDFLARTVNGGGEPPVCGDRSTVPRSGQVAAGRGLPGEADATIAAGGPLYTEGLIDLLGVTNLGDSLLVLKRIVYDEQRLSLAEFVQILDGVWQGTRPCARMHSIGIPSSATMIRRQTPSRCAS